MRLFRSGWIAILSVDSVKVEANPLPYYLIDMRKWLTVAASKEKKKQQRLVVWLTSDSASRLLRTGKRVSQRDALPLIGAWRVGRHTKRD
jgi:hypothetical protein